MMRKSYVSFFCEVCEFSLETNDTRDTKVLQNQILPSKKLFKAGCQKINKFFLVELVSLVLVYKSYVSL